MGDINETISVDAAPGIAGLKEFTSALEDAAGKWADFQAKLSSGLGGGGADKLAASMNKAAASISAAADRAAASLDRIGAAADPAAAGLERLDEAAATAEGSLASAAAGADEAAAASDRLAESADAAGAALDRQAAAGARAGKAGAESMAGAEASAKRYHMLALAGAAAIGYGIYKAAQLQTAVTKLYTSAGESQKNLPMISQGILGLSGSTATSQSELASGAYMIESAGFHGKSALQVLKAAAQGARAEGAPLGDVGNALTSLMNAYGMQPSQATSAMNQIITMVSRGKMTMAGAVSALPQMLPAAAAAHLSFGQAGGALATMTAMGMSPDQAAQNIRHTIGVLQNPSNIQRNELGLLGINAVSLSKNLGKEGLTGSIQQVETAILRNMGPAGTVLLKSFNASKLAAQSATQEIAAMPAPLQKTAQAYLDGAVSTGEWRQELKALPPLQANMLSQFAATANAAHGFNSQLKSGGSNAQTFSAALSKAMGGTVGMNTALMLGGAHMATFRANAQAVSAAARDAGQNVKGWSDIQHTFNFQLQSFKYSAEAAATSVGAALLPAATKVMGALAKGGSFLAGHKTLTLDVAMGAGLLALPALLAKLSHPLVTGLNMVGKVAEVLKIPGLDKLANIGGGGAGGALGKVAASGDAAAASLDRLAGAADKAAVGEDAAGVAGDKAAAGLGAGGLGGGLKGLGGKVLGGALLASILIPLGAELNKYIGKQVGRTNQGGAEVSQAGVNAAVGAAIGAQIAGPVGALVGAEAGLIYKLSTMNTKQSLAPVTGGRGPTANAGAGGGPGGLAFRQQSGEDTAALQAAANRVAAQRVARLSAAAPPVSPSSRYGLEGLREGAKIVPTVDTSKAKGQLSQFTSMLAQSMGKPVKMPPPDISALTGAKGKAQADAKAIETSIEQALHKKATAAPPDLSAYTRAAGQARGDGVAISHGLAQGIEAGKGAAVAAAQDVAGAVASAMASSLKVRSPSKVTEKIGKDTVAGLVL
ncbi:MAG TPA: phage tail tape measure protein, partial [Acetobacteraceae bacterium]|nr:phage tail tape measure protein [Acetobacteraceae bacterium]